MKITLEEMREIAKRLPIGYYLGRKTPVIIEPDGGAFCDAVKGDVHIGLSLLQIAADNIDPADAEKWDREALLRCLLYHEIGHLLLTPKDIYFGVDVRRKCSRADERSFINIFEDERLERTLSHFFLGVDFRGFCRLVNKAMLTSSAEAKTDTHKFFCAVRLRRTSPEISAMIDDAIEALVEVTATTYLGLGPYEEWLNRLIDAILKEPEKDESKGESSPGSDGESPKDHDKPEDRRESESEDDSEDESEESESDGESEGESEGDADESGDEGEPDKSEMEESPDKPDGESEECVPGDDGDDAGIEPRDIDVPDNLLSSTASRIFIEPPDDVTTVLNRFALRLSKKKGQQAAGCWSGLHGRIDPKRDAIGKERIFRRRSDVGESLMNAVNLTIWVDVSGSFASSKDTLNKILTATARAMDMSSGKLEVNVVKMGDYARVANPTEWFVNPSEGNTIDPTYYEAWRSTRKRDRRNIDIVVFDGDAKSDDRVESRAMPDGRSVEGLIWDHPDCWMVCDLYNQKYFKRLRKAHITYINGGYAKRLQSEVIKILDRIL